MEFLGTNGWVEGLKQAVFQGRASWCTSGLGTLAGGGRRRR